MKTIKRCTRIFPVVLGLVLMLFSLTAPVSAAGTLDLSPSQGPPLTTVTVSGTFSGDPTTSATISFDGVNIGFATVIAGDLGGTFQVPVKARGTYSVVVSITGDTATDQFTVVPRVNLSATSGYVGDQVTVSGNGFSPGPVYIYMDASTSALVTTSANTSGVLTAANITIPAATKAVHVIRAVDSAGSAYAATTNFEVEPKLGVSPASGGAGDQITITGSGFAGSSLITITLDGDEISTSPATVNSGTTGGFTAAFTIAEDISRGAHSIIATDLMGNSAAGIVMVEDKVVLSAVTGFVGDKIDIDGSGFAPSKTITLYFDSSIIPTTNLRTDSSGSFSAQDVTIPPGTKGNHTIKARDAEGNESSAVFTISPRMTASAASGPVGTQVTLSGTGFAGSSVVTILFDEIAQGTTQADPSGSFTDVSLSVPASVKGSHTIKARDGSNNQATAPFTTSPSMAINLNTGPVGTKVILTGSGFAASSVLTVFYDSAILKSLATDASGSFSGVEISVPASAKGSHTIKAQDTGNNQASASFAVTSAITLSPVSGFVGSPVVVNGTGFAASTPSAFAGVSLVLDTSTGIQPTGTSIINTDDKGSFTATFAIPPAVRGEHIIRARDTADNSAQAVLGVVPKLVLGVSSGVAGDQVSLAGTGFAGAKAVIVRYGGTAVATEPAAAATDATGSFSARITVPARPAGTFAIDASDGTNSSSSDFTAGVFAAIDKTTTQAAPGYVGIDLAVSGTGFKASSAISVVLDGNIQLALGQSDANGTMSVSFKMIAVAGGEHSIRVSDGTTAKTFPFIMESQAPPAPALLLPANGSKPEQPVVFDWDAVSDPSGLVYDFQISNDASFSTLVMEKRGLADTGYTMTETERLDSVSAKTPYQWRVRAVDGAGNVGAWTAPAAFVIGFIWPGWLTYVLFGVGLLLFLYIGMRIGSRIALRATEYKGYEQEK